MSHTPIVYFVEGNIGTGKSTFLKMIEKCYPDDCQVIYEPLDTWTSFKDKEGVNILGHFYKDPKRYAYTFQIGCAFAVLRNGCRNSRIASDFEPCRDGMPSA